tara:strand:- start:2362 stop:3099 length:738 start_codon:yes stop_codon:yes gene_type:complete
MESEETWKRILDRQLNQLAMVDGVVITAQGFVNQNPAHTIYHNQNKTYTHGVGFQQIEFTLNCKAIVDCDPRKAGSNDDTPYRIQPTDVEIREKHKMVFCFPRGFPHDSIGWGFYFEDSEKVPMYSNLTCTQTTSGHVFYKFNGRPLQRSLRPGIICIGAAGSKSARPMHELVVNLKSYLLMEDKKLFIHTEDPRGGNNDGGFDYELLLHLQENYDVLKNAIDNHGPKQRRKLGGDKKLRRRLGS